MLGFNGHQHFYIYTGPTDMRKGFDGLSGLVRNELGEDPTCGSVYVFFNRTRRMVKLLVWDHDGFAIYGKRLEKGSFEHLTKLTKGKKQAVEYQHLVMLLSGISLLGIRHRPRYVMTKMG
jgi:transposase